MSPSARLLGCLVVLLAPPTWAAQPLDGWNGYKFGQSPDAARAVPGLTFGRFTPKNLMNEDAGAMSAQNNAMLNGRAYRMTLLFNASQKLTEIILENQIDLNQPDCEKRFLGLMTVLEKTYGPFKAVDPQRKRNDAETPPTALAWKKQGPSGYQLSTVFLSSETASAWKARVVQNANYADVTAAWSGKADSDQAPCLTDVDFKAS